MSQAAIKRGPKETDKDNYFKIRDAMFAEADDDSIARRVLTSGKTVVHVELSLGKPYYDGYMMVLRRKVHGVISSAVLCHLLGLFFPGDSYRVTEIKTPAPGFKVVYAEGVN